MDWDCLFVPDPADEGFFKEVKLNFTGHHYRMPIDKFKETGPFFKYKMVIQRSKIY